MFKGIAVDIAVANEFELKADVGINALERGDEGRRAIVREGVVEFRLCKKFIATFKEADEECAEVMS